MPRAKISLGEKWEETFLSRLAPVLAARLAAEAMTERELADLAVALAGTKELAGELKRLYSLQYSRHLSERTAVGTIRRVALKSLAAALSRPPAGVRKSKSRIRIGSSGRMGFLYFPSEKAAAEKLRKLYLAAKRKSLGREILLSLGRRNFLRLASLPYPRRQVEASIAPLLEFSVVEERIAPDGNYLCLPSEPVADSEAKPADGKLLREAEREFAGEEITRGLEICEWVLGAQGLRRMTRRISFAAVAGNILHLCDVSARQATVAKLRELREKAALLRLPAKLHLFAPAFSEEALEYAEKTGIAAHTLPGGKS